MSCVVAIVPACLKDITRASFERSSVNVSLNQDLTNCSVDCILRCINYHLCAAVVAFVLPVLSSLSADHLKCIPHLILQCGIINYINVKVVLICLLRRTPRFYTILLVHQVGSTTFMLSTLTMCENVPTTTPKNVSNDV